MLEIATDELKTLSMDHHGLVAAVYTKDRLLKNNDYTWLTRVPETIKEAKILLDKIDQEINWEIQDNGYKIAGSTSNYSNLPQRWVLVFSEQAHQREVATFEKKFTKKRKSIALEIRNKAIKN